MRDASEPSDRARDAIGVIPTSFSMRGPKTIPRVDYERIFVLDSQANLLGEYALNDECPLESGDLMRSIPVNGLRHLVAFYQGEYGFTPFKVDDLWFVILTRGVPRIEERGSVGTLLAAARIHIPPMIEPLLARREADLRAREQELAQRESELARREQRTAGLESEFRMASDRVTEKEAEVRAREAQLVDLRDYALQIERTFVPAKTVTGKGGGPATPTRATTP